MTLRHIFVAMVYSMLEGAAVVQAVLVAEEFHECFLGAHPAPAPRHREGAAPADDHGSVLPVEGIDVQGHQLLPLAATVLRGILITNYNTRATPG